MKTKLTALLLTLASVTACATAYAENEITVTVNGSNIEFAEITPFIENEHTLVAMREIFEALGASVQWDGDTKTIFSYDPASNVSVVMQIGADNMYVNGEAVELETPAKIVGSSTVVPVRAIAEGMKSNVEWDGENQQVIVTKEINKD